MKRLLFSAFLAALTLGLTSCPGDNPVDPTAADLIGTWEQYQLYYIYKENGTVVDEDTVTATRDYSIRVTFNTGGACVSEHYDEGELSETMPGTWSLSGNTLNITSDGDDMSLSIEKFDSETLVLSSTYHEVAEGVTYDDYERMTYKKVN